MMRNDRYKLKRGRVSLTLTFLPFLIYIIAFKYVPILGWGLAFVRYKPGLSFDQCKFVGMENFMLLFKNWEHLSNVLINTFAISGLSILFSPFPLIFAILLNEVKSVRFKKIVQTFTTIPHFVSFVIVYSLAFSLFSTEGVVNTILIDIGLIDSPTNILANKDLTWIFQTLLTVWKSFGWNAIIYFAAITGIDSELYEAAYVDGAGRFQKIWHITVPGVINTYFVLLLLSISSFLSNGLDQYLAFYNSIISDKIMVLDLYTYRMGLVSADYSYSTAIGIIKTFVSIVLLFSVNAFSKKVRGNSII